VNNGNVKLQSAELRTKYIRRRNVRKKVVDNE